MANDDGDQVSGAASTSTQTIRYLLVGSAGWCVNIAAFGLLEHVHVPYIAAAVASYLVSNVLMWIGNRLWTFGPSGDSLLREYLRYLLVGATTTLIANVVLLALFVSVFGLPHLAAQMLALSAAVPVSFIAFKYWAFADRAH